MTTTARKTLFACFGLAVSLPAWSQERTTPDRFPGTFGGNAAIVSDYAFRGISQTDENPAAQAGIDWRHDGGPLAGIWGSNVDFNDGGQAGLELDWYAGYADNFGRLGWDVRAIYYHYPGADVARDYDFWEVAAAATLPGVLPDVDAALGYIFSPDFFAQSGMAHYAHLDGAWTPGFLPLPLSLKGTAGRQWVEDNVFFGTPDYWHWSAGISLPVEKVRLSLTYSDTDIKRSECGASLGTCGARFIAGLGAAF